jgi:hypothetical protein
VTEAGRYRVQGRSPVSFCGARETVDSTVSSPARLIEVSWRVIIDVMFACARLMIGSRTISSKGGLLAISRAACITVWHANVSCP